MKATASSARAGRRRSAAGLNRPLKMRATAPPGLRRGAAVGRPAPLVTRSLPRSAKSTGDRRLPLFAEARVVFCPPGPVDYRAGGQDLFRSGDEPGVELLGLRRHEALRRAVGR